MSLSKTLGVFLELPQAAAALTAEGFPADERAIVELAAHGKLRLCFPYCGYLGPLVREPGDGRITFASGYLALPPINASLLLGSSFTRPFAVIAFDIAHVIRVDDPEALLNSNDSPHFMLARWRKWFEPFPGGEELDGSLVDGPLGVLVEDLQKLVRGGLSPTTQPHDASEAHSATEALEALFDPVRIGALEKMFPAGGKWEGWHKHAKESGLAAARQGRGTYNPYRAAMFFLKKNHQGFDLARCLRALANNLPVRSSDQKHLLTGDFE
jgi:hypothetical protein